ncbi:MAG: ArgE/DapE family deacylase [Candidatus Promineifilaceae bacterium]
MEEVERRVLNAIDTDGLLGYLCQLVAVPSLSGQEAAAQESVARKLASVGLEVDVWSLDFASLKQHAAYTVEVERSEGLGVVGMLGEGKGPSLILNGHVDVVPAGDPANWRYPPWEGTIADGRVYGRGALDMKGGLTCALFAAKAIVDAGLQLKGRLLIESVIGEEDGGVGTLAAVLRGYQADGAVVMEPTRLIIAPAQAGALNFRVTIKGLSAHGAIREEGVSAIERFVPVYQALMELEAERNRPPHDPLFATYELPYPICVGTMRAGDWASSVADWLIFEGRYGVAVGEDLAEARRMLEAAVSRAAAADPWLQAHRPQVEWWGAQFAPAAIPVEHPLVRSVAGAFTGLTGAVARIEGMTYGADMRLLVNEGNTPTVLFGPGDIRLAHRPDESVPIDDLLVVTQVLALTALRFCGYE